jgi:hypothetical protein
MPGFLQSRIGGAFSCRESAPPLVCKASVYPVCLVPRRSPWRYFLAAGVEVCSLVGGTMPLIRIYTTRLP